MVTGTRTFIATQVEQTLREPNFPTPTPSHSLFINTKECFINDFKCVKKLFVFSEKFERISFLVYLSALISERVILHSLVFVFLQARQARVSKMLKHTRKRNVFVNGRPDGVGDNISGD